MEVKQSDCGKFQAVHYKEEKFQPHTNGCFPTVRPQTNWGILYYFVSLITLASLPLFLTLWFHGREFRQSQCDVGDLKARGWGQRAQAQYRWYWQAAAVWVENI